MILKQMYQSVEENEFKASEDRRVKKKLEVENSELTTELLELQSQMENHDEFSKNAQRAFESARDTFQQEKQDIIDRMEREKIEWCDRQHGNY